jgi:putative phosphoribosyl transferase
VPVLLPRKGARALALNEGALEQLNTDKRLEVVPGAGHLFERPGALEEGVDLALAWFQHTC